MPAVESLTYQTVYNAADITLAKGETKQIVVQRDIGARNYFVAELSCDMPVKGTIKMTDAKGSKYEEAFFCEAGFSGEFRQILDYYQLHLGSKTIDGVTFQNVGNTAGVLQLNKVKVAERAVDDVLYDNHQHFLSSTALKLGIDMRSGGAIHYLEYIRQPVQQVKDAYGNVLVGVDYAERNGVTLMYNTNVNLLNRYDRGRLVQQSYYGIQSEPYQVSQYMNSPWPYNPVQGGNWEGTSSQVIDFHITSEQIYVKCRALDWAKGSAQGGYSITPSYMENWYTVDGDMIKVQNRFVDFSGYEHIVRDQELPAFYGVISLGTLVTYRGNAPFTSQALSYYDNLGSWMDVSSRAKWYDLNEHWLAWVNEDDFGVGVYTPNAHETLSGRVGTASTQPSGRIETSSATTYSTLIAQIRLTTYEPFAYDYYISVGRVSSMRKAFNKLAKTEVNEDIKEWTE